MTTPEPSAVKVWDPFVRMAHWTIVLGFFVAYLADDDALTVHVWAGYGVGVLVILRVIWGLIGPWHARFADFVYQPRTAVGYLRDLLLARAPPRQSQPGRRRHGAGPARLPGSDSRDRSGDLC